MALFPLPRSSRRGGISIVDYISALSTSQGIPTDPAALPLFSCLITILNSCLVSVALYISRSWAAGKMTCGFCGGGLLSRSALPISFFAVPHPQFDCLSYLSLLFLDSRTFPPASYKHFLHPRPFIPVKNFGKQLNFSKAPTSPLP